MRVQESAERHQARVKSRRASFAAPGKDSREAEEIVQHRPSLGTPGIRAVTDWAACQAGFDRLSPFRA